MSPDAAEHLSPSMEKKDEKPLTLDIVPASGNENVDKQASTGGMYNFLVSAESSHARYMLIPASEFSTMPTHSVGH